MSAAVEARRFLHSTRSAVLSTHSARFEGYPLILISTIAEHTKNIQADPRVSLIAFEPNAADLQASGRLTLIGNAEAVPKDDSASRDRYLRYFPQAQRYFDTHDFLFYRILVQQARYIGGFGKIHWIDGSQLRPPSNKLAQQESAIIEHMNADHADSLRAYCRHWHQIEPQQAHMLGIDTDGFDVLADGLTLRFTFEQPVTDAESARTAMVATSKTARS
jgi:hypothetical protein